ncbi:MAG: ATP-binding protein [Candidatus Kuenenbacteria bacterium]
MYIKRKLEDTILKYLNVPEIIAIIGPRQSGKTTILNKIFSKLKKAEYLNFDDKKVLNLFENDVDSFREIYVKNFDYLFIDEFQYAKNGGSKLKYIFDKNKQENRKVKIFISGSSSIDLVVNAVKYLVGRIFIFNLYPLDFEEYLGYCDKKFLPLFKKGNKCFKNNEKFKISNEAQVLILKHFDEYTLYGGYPRVVLSKNAEEKKQVLKNIYNTYFLREVRNVLGLIDDYKLEKLIQALALQIGNLIDYKELSVLSEYSYPTLKKYLNFLEKTFVCSFVRPFYKNKRIEIVKNPKVYFFDTGLRNYIINDFRLFDERNDLGALLENVIFEQLKKNEYNFNYWRTKQRQEIDFILHLAGGHELALEVKNNYKKSSRSFYAIKSIYKNMNLVIATRKAIIQENNITQYPIFVIG